MGFKPPEADTLFYYHADPKGNPKPAAVTKSMLTDIGIISTAFPITRKMARYDKEITAVEGKVVDLSGAPVEGALVMAFPIPAYNPRPLFVSERTNKEGKFMLRTHDGGNYNLRVRGIYGGGPPDSGEFVGSNGPVESIRVVLKKGEKLKGVVLKVKKFPKRGPGYETK